MELLSFFVRCAVFLFVVLSVTPATSVAPTPKQLAGLVADRIVANRSVFFGWNYGGALIFDGLFQVSEVFGFPYKSLLDSYLQGYLDNESSYGYEILHSEPIPVQSAIGDGVGLFPINYLNRAISNKMNSTYNNETDILVAKTVLDKYVLGWQYHLNDSTISRMHGWDDQVGNHTFVWADDAFMGLTLASRLAIALNRSDYALFAAQQQELLTYHLINNTDGLFYHGYNDENKINSCCKWGRGNGWIMMSHLEVLEALEYFNLPEAATVKTILRRHAMEITKVQAADGRWRQLLDYPDAFLETSCTAMFLSTIARAAERQWLPNLPRWKYILDKAWSGLAKAVESTGEVTGICVGTGIQDDASDYLKRPTDYYRSGPGGLGAVLRAAAHMELFLKSLQA